MKYGGQRAGYARAKGGAFAQGGNIKNQHRAYLESGPPLEYIFEAGKLKEALIINGVDVTAEQYVRSKFLQMYKENSSYFVETAASRSFWNQINGTIVDTPTLLSFLNNQSYNSPWLSFIKIK